MRYLVIVIAGVIAVLWFAASTSDGPAEPTGPTAAEIRTAAARSAPRATASEVPESGKRIRHPVRAELPIEILHRSRGLKVGARLSPAEVKAVQEGLATAYENLSDPRELAALANSDRPQDRAAHRERTYNTVLLAEEIHALDRGSYILYGGPDRKAFYKRCVTEHTEYTFAMVGRDREAREIIVAIPSPDGSPVQEAAHQLVHAR